MSHADSVSGFTVERRKQPYSGVSATTPGRRVERRKRPFVYIMSDADAMPRSQDAPEGYPSGHTASVSTLKVAHTAPVSDDIFNLLAVFQEKERERVAADLHDSIGSALTAIKFRIEDTMRHLEVGSPSDTASRLDNVTMELTRTIEEVRRIAMNLRPAMLDHLGIVATINWYCRELESFCPGLQITKQIEVVEKIIPCQLKTAIFRILQEAATNTIKHSGAKELHVSMTHDGCTLHLSVKDNGVGFNAEQPGPSSAANGGLGHIGMHQRMKSTGGTLRIQSKRGIGTRVVAEWPLRVMRDFAPGPQP